MKRVLLLILCTIVLPVGAARAAGPYDGTWYGSWCQGGGHVLVTIGGGQIKGAVTGTVIGSAFSLQAEMPRRALTQGSSQEIEVDLQEPGSSGQIVGGLLTPVGRELNLQVSRCGLNLVRTSVISGCWIIPATQCPNANLSRADLTGAVLSGANLQGADLQGTNLQGANLGGANLRGAKLTGANMSNANLQGADLFDAALDGVNFTGAQLSGALTGRRCAPGSVGRCN